MNAIEKGLAELLREAYASGDCPPAESWLELQAGNVDAAQAQWLEAHVASCNACAAERALCAAFTADGDDDVAEDDLDFVVKRLAAQRHSSDNVVPMVARRRRLVQPLLALATAAALVLAVLPVIGPMLWDAPVLPPPEAGTVVRGTHITALEPTGGLSALPQALRWEPHSGAARYRATIRTVDDAILWQNTVPPSDSVEIPVSALEQMHAAVVYTWQVEALDERGNRIAASTPESFRVLPGEQR